MCTIGQDALGVKVGKDIKEWTNPRPEVTSHTRLVGTVSQQQVLLLLQGQCLELWTLVDRMVLVVALDADQLIKMVWIPLDALQRLMAATPAPATEVGASVIVPNAVSLKRGNIILLLLFFFLFLHVFDEYAVQRFVLLLLLSFFDGQLLVLHLLCRMALRWHS